MTVTVCHHTESQHTTRQREQPGPSIGPEGSSKYLPPDDLPGRPDTSSADDLAKSLKAWPECHLLHFRRLGLSQGHGSLLPGRRRSASAAAITSGPRVPCCCFYADVPDRLSLRHGQNWGVKDCC